ncbi:MAG TPA: redoxin domain-containing protein [Pirellulales bacterium]|nr:redoxin domain-containing protein [Pirellulales bacterium]
MSASLGLRSGRGVLIVVAGSIVLSAFLATGCTQRTTEKVQTVERKPPSTPTEILERAIEAYHQANRYQDSGRLLVRYSHDGKIVEDARDFSLAMDGPNRIRMRAYDVLVVCDGHTFRATIDEAPGEVFSVPAPEELSLLSIYGEPVLANALNQIVGSVPLALFLDPQPLPAIVANAREPELDSPQKIGADNCYRVRIAKREGDFVLWIDQKTFVVRRVEYPPGGYRRLIEPYVGAISDMTITAELEDARLDPPLDDATFRFEMPPDAELVKQFDAVLPGARIPKFELRTLDGRQITRDSLAGKIAVLKFWQKDDVFKYYNDLSVFERVRKRYQDQDAVVFLAVSADLDEVSDDDLKAVLAKAELSLPIARVSRQIVFRSFGVQTVPTTVILGRDGSLQEHLVGVYPNEAVALPKQIDTLLAGGDLTLEAPEKAPEYLFYAGFAWQNTQRPNAGLESAFAAALAPAGIAPPSEPELLLRKRLWVCSELRQPGNILVAHEDSGHDRVFVIEGLPSVAEIDAEGKVLAKHRLELPERDDSAITFLRTSVDGAGNRYFLGSKPGVQQIHLFDASWKRLLSFPESSDHSGISDALLADLDGNGELEMYVGYLEDVGVHCVTLDGRRLWRNRAAGNVLRLDVTGPDRRGQRQLLVAQGTVLPIDAAGRERPPIALPDAIVRLIFTADLDGDDFYEWCAIALRSPGAGESLYDDVVGLTPRGDELWNYPLPEGMHQHAAFEMVATGNLLGGETGQWVIAAADGSIHILASDGSLIDRFNFGASPSGIAVAQLDGRPALLLATDEGLEAWQFEIPPLEEPAAAPAEAKPQAAADAASSER